MTLNSVGEVSQCRVHGAHVAQLPGLAEPTLGLSGQQHALFVARQGVGVVADRCVDVTQTAEGVGRSLKQHRHTENWSVSRYLKPSRDGKQPADTKKQKQLDVLSNSIVSDSFTDRGIRQLPLTCHRAYGRHYRTDTIDTQLILRVITSLVVLNYLNYYQDKYPVQLTHSLFYCNLEAFIVINFSPGTVKYIVSYRNVLYHIIIALYHIIIYSIIM